MASVGLKCKAVHFRQFEKSRFQTANSYNFIRRGVRWGGGRKGARGGGVGGRSGGFREGFSTTDNLFILYGLLGITKGNKAKLICAFINFKQAFDNVWRNGLLKKTTTTKTTTTKKQQQQKTKKQQ